MGLGRATVYLVFKVIQFHVRYFLSSSSGKKYVLRKKPEGKLIKGAHAVEREFRVMSALGAAGFTAPNTYQIQLVLVHRRSLHGSSRKART